MNARLTCIVLPAALLLASCAMAQKVPPPPPEITVGGRLEARRANVLLEADDVGATINEIRRVAEKHKGAVANASLDSEKHGQHKGQIDLRIPPAAFDDFLADVASLGEERHRDSHSTDYTEEITKTQAEIRKWQDEERRLQEHLRRRGQLDELLQLEQRIAQTRQNIEANQGTLRKLLDQVTWARATIDVRQNVTAADIAAAEGKAREWSAGLVLRQAWTALRAVGRGTGTVGIWFFVFSLVWLPVAAVVWGLGQYSKRRRTAERSESS